MEAPSTAKAFSRLENLPEEILDSIAGYAPGDILSFRSASKAIQEKTQHAFLRDLISVRTLWVNRPSMQSLENLSKSEALGQHVRKILIMNYEWEVDTAEGIWGDGDDLDDEETRLFKAFYDDWTDQTYLLQSGAFTMFLAQILPKFPKLEAIELFPSEYNDDFEPNTRLEWIERVALSSTLTDEFINSSWLSLCQAIIASGWKPKSLKVGMDEDNQLRAECLICLVKPQRQLLALAFSQLDIVHLGFQLPYGGLDLKMVLEALVDFLKLCSNISELSLQASDEDGDPYNYREEDSMVSNIDKWPIFPKLRSLTLCWMHCYTEHLQSYIMKHQATLKRLGLSDVHLKEDDTWRLLLEEIGEKLDLDEVDISFFEERHGQVEMVFEKRPNIKQAIEDRVREGIFCYKCSNGAGDYDSDDPEGYDSDDGAEIDSELHSLVDEDEDDDWEDE